MTLWHRSYARDTADGASRAGDGLKRPRDADRPADRWPPLRALAFMVVANLALWALILAGLWLLL